MISGLNTKYSILIICMAFLLSGYDLGEVRLDWNKTPAQPGVLSGGVTYTNDLPREFYGTWSVISELIETNRPELFRERSTDIWSFSRDGDMITLTNPVTGARASITVNEVVDKTATFTRTKEEEGLVETETPKITVEEDSFYGTDLIIMKHYRNGRRTKTNIVKYKVTGYKISGPTLKDIFAQ